MTKTKSKTRKQVVKELNALVSQRATKSGSVKKKAKRC